MNDDFLEVHPDRFGGQVDGISIRHGLNFDKTTYLESGYLYCKKCGYILNKHRHPKGWELGYSHPYTQLNGTVTAGATTITVDSTTGFATPATGSITAFASDGTNRTKVTSASHGLKGGQIKITSTTSYNGTFNIIGVATNFFVIAIAYVANDATGTWTVPNYIYIYDTGIINSTTGSRSNKVSYTGKTSTTFTGCSDVTGHADNIYVRGERVAGRGCPLCSTFIYD